MEALVVGHRTMCGLAISQIARVTTCQFDVYVQDHKDALSYPIHEFLVKLEIIVLCLRPS